MADLPEVTVLGDAPAPPKVEDPGIAAVSPAEGKVAIRDDDGSISLVAKGDLQAAMAEGARPASSDEYLAAKAGKIGEVASAAIGAGRGATFGLSDPLAIEAARALGGDAEAEKTRAALDLARRVNPNATLGGEIAGSLAPLLLSGGASGAATVASEGSALARAGRGVLAAAPRLLGEGALMGGGHVMSENALGNHEQTAQKILSGAAGGAVLNLLLGGALHMGGGAIAEKLGSLGSKAEGELTRGLTTYGAKDIESLAAREFGATEKGLGEKVRQQLAKVSAGVSGKDAATIERLTRLDAEGRELRRVAVFDSEKELEKAHATLRTAGDDFLKATPSVTEEFRGAMKAEKIATAVRTDNEAQAVAFARKHIRETIETVENELRHANGVAPQSIKSLESISRSAYHADASIAEAIAKGENVNARAFTALDVLKRDVQGLTDGGYRRVAAMSDPFEGRLMRRTVDTMNETQERLRTGLESADVWGKAGDIQAAINADWSRQIEAAKRFNNALTTDVGRDAANPFLRQKGIDPAKLDSYTRNLLNPNADLTHQAVKDYVASTESLAKTMRENLALTPEKLAQVKRIEAAAAKFRTTVEATEKNLTTVNQYKQIMGANGDSAAGLASALGFAAGGPIGGALGTAVGALANPGKTVAQLAALERMGAKVDSKIGDAVRGFFGKGSAKTEEVAARKVTSEQVRELRQLVSNPAAVRARISEALAPIEAAAPQVARAMSVSMLRMAEHLAKKLPPEPMPSNFSFGQAPPRRLSDVQLAKAQRIIGSVDSLDDVLKGVANKRLNRESVQGLKDVYPMMFEALKMQLRTEGEKLKPQMSIQQQVALSVLFGEPLNAMMQPKNIRAFQETFSQGADPSQTAQAGGPGTAAPKRPLAHAGGSRGSAWDTLGATSGKRS